MFALACLLAGLFWLGRGKRVPEPTSATLPMPDASSPRAPAGLPLALDSRAPGAASATAPSTRAPEAPEPASSVREPAAPVATEEDKAGLLDEVLRSGDDNDPRLDDAFNGLPLETRRRFQKKYRELSPESRNQRGTIVYLLGKNIDAPEDWAFLRQVAGEPPCLSLIDCAKASAAGGPEAPGAAITLAYPALVALKQAERVLTEGKSTDRREALAVVRAGKDSGVPIVAAAAARLEGL
ncbi:MAG: hypothetical protein AAB262_08880 [Elusimicrobiota bacterium]